MQPVPSGLGTGAAIHDPFGVAKVESHRIDLALSSVQGFVGLEIPAEQLIIEEELSKDKDGEDIGRFGKVFKGRCFGLEVLSALAAAFCPTCLHRLR